MKGELVVCAAGFFYYKTNMKNKYAKIKLLKSRIWTV